MASIVKADFLILQGTIWRKINLIEDTSYFLNEIPLHIYLKKSGEISQIFQCFYRP